MLPLLLLLRLDLKSPSAIQDKTHEAVLDSWFRQTLTELIKSKRVLDRWSMECRWCVGIRHNI